MKRVQLLCACALAFAIGSAKADDLVITANGLQTYYSGTLFHVETDGMSGEVIMDAEYPGSYAENGDPGPTDTGLWHVVVRGNAAGVDTVMACSVTTATTAGLGRVSMNCADLPSPYARKR